MKYKISIDIPLLFILYPPQYLARTNKAVPVELLLLLLLLAPLLLQSHLLLRRQLPGELCG